MTLGITKGHIAMLAVVIVAVVIAVVFVIPNLPKSIKKS